MRSLEDVRMTMNKHFEVFLHRKPGIIKQDVVDAIEYKAGCSRHVIFKILEIGKT
jgi:hypothetical protein